MDINTDKLFLLISTTTDRIVTFNRKTLRPDIWKASEVVRARYDSNRQDSFP